MTQNTAATASPILVAEDCWACASPRPFGGTGCTLACPDCGEQMPYVRSEGPKRTRPLDRLR